MMQIPSWDSSLSVGNEEIDNQHRALLGLGQEVVRLHTLAQTEPARRQLPEVLRDLLYLAARHFVTEEETLARNGYPTRLEHTQAHQARLGLLTGLVGREGDAPAGGTGIAEVFYAYCSEHLLELDSSCRKYMKGEES